jgi:hypothetical protein
VPVAGAPVIGPPGLAAASFVVGGTV